jgi:hypothetical protein
LRGATKARRRGVGFLREERAELKSAEKLRIISSIFSAVRGAGAVADAGQGHGQVVARSWAGLGSLRRLRAGRRRPFRSRLAERMTPLEPGGL